MSRKSANHEETSSEQRHEIFEQALVEEFLAELDYVVDVRWNRAAERSTKRIQRILNAIKAHPAKIFLAAAGFVATTFLTGGVGAGVGIGALILGMATDLPDFNESKHLHHNNMLAYQTHDLIESLLRRAAVHASHHLGYYIDEVLSPESIDGLGRSCARRMLAYFFKASKSLLPDLSEGALAKLSLCEMQQHFIDQHEDIFTLFTKSLFSGDFGKTVELRTQKGKTITAKAILDQSPIRLVTETEHGVGVRYHFRDNHDTPAPGFIEIPTEAEFEYLEDHCGFTQKRSVRGEAFKNYRTPMLFLTKADIGRYLEHQEENNLSESLFAYFQRISNSRYYRLTLPPLAPDDWEALLSISRDFRRIDFFGQKFPRDISRCIFDDAVLDYCDMRQVKRAVRCDFKGARLMFCLLPERQNPHQLKVTKSSFANALLLGVDWKTAELTGSRFEGAYVRGVNFRKVTYNDAVPGVPFEAFEKQMRDEQEHYYVQMDEKLTQVQSNIDSLGEQVDEVAWQADLRFDIMEERMDEITSKIARLTSDVETLKDRADAAEVKNERQDHQIVQMQAEITVLKKTVFDQGKVFREAMHFFRANGVMDPMDDLHTRVIEARSQVCEMEIPQLLEALFSFESQVPKRFDRWQRKHWDQMNRNFPSVFALLLTVSEKLQLEETDVAMLIQLHQLLKPLHAYCVLTQSHHPKINADIYVMLVFHRRLVNQLEPNDQGAKACSEIDRITLLKYVGISAMQAGVDHKAVDAYFDEALGRLKALGAEPHALLKGALLNNRVLNILRKEVLDEDDFVVMNQYSLTSLEVLGEGKTPERAIALSTRGWLRLLNEERLPEGTTAWQSFNLAKDLLTLLGQSTHPYYAMILMGRAISPSPRSAKTTREKDLIDAKSILETYPQYAPQVDFIQQLQELDASHRWRINEQRYSLFTLVMNRDKPDPDAKDLKKASTGKSEGSFSDFDVEGNDDSDDDIEKAEALIAGLTSDVETLKDRADAAEVKNERQDHQIVQMQAQILMIQKMVFDSRKVIQQIMHFYFNKTDEVNSISGDFHTQLDQTRFQECDKNVSVLLKELFSFESHIPKQLDKLQLNDWEQLYRILPSVTSLTLNLSAKLIINEMDVSEFQRLHLLLKSLEAYFVYIQSHQLEQNTDFYTILVFHLCLIKKFEHYNPNENLLLEIDKITLLKYLGMSATLSGVDSKEVDDYYEEALDRIAGLNSDLNRLQKVALLNNRILNIIKKDILNKRDFENMIAYSKTSFETIGDECASEKAIALSIRGWLRLLYQEKFSQRTIAWEDFNLAKGILTLLGHSDCPLYAMILMGRAISPRPSSVTISREMDLIEAYRILGRYPSYVSEAHFIHQLQVLDASSRWSNSQYYSLFAIVVNQNEPDESSLSVSMNDQDFQENNKIIDACFTQDVDTNTFSESKIENNDIVSEKLVIDKRRDRHYQFRESYVKEFLEIMDYELEINWKRATNRKNFNCLDFVKDHPLKMLLNASIHMASVIFGESSTLAIEAKENNTLLFLGSELDGRAEEKDVSTLDFEFVHSLELRAHLESLLHRSALNASRCLGFVIEEVLEFESCADFGSICGRRTFETFKEKSDLLVDQPSALFGAMLSGMLINDYGSNRKLRIRQDNQTKRVKAKSLLEKLPLQKIIGHTGQENGLIYLYQSRKSKKKDEKNPKGFIRIDDKMLEDEVMELCSYREIATKLYDNTDLCDRFAAYNPLDRFLRIDELLEYRDDQARRADKQSLREVFSPQDKYDLLVLPVVPEEKMPIWHDLLSIHPNFSKVDFFRQRFPQSVVWLPKDIDDNELDHQHRKALISRSFQGAWMDWCDMQELIDARGCDFGHAHLFNWIVGQDTVLNIDLRRAHFQHATVIGIGWGTSQFSFNGEFFMGAKLLGCNFEHAKFDEGKAEVNVQVTKQLSLIQEEIKNRIEKKSVWINLRASLISMIETADSKDEISMDRIIKIMVRHLVTTHMSYDFEQVEKLRVLQRQDFDILTNEVLAQDNLLEAIFTHERLIEDFNRPLDISNFRTLEDLKKLVTLLLQLKNVVVIESLTQKEVERLLGIISPILGYLFYTEDYLTELNSAVQDLMAFHYELVSKVQQGEVDTEAISMDQLRSRLMMTLGSKYYGISLLLQQNCIKAQGLFEFVIAEIDNYFKLNEDMEIEKFQELNQEKLALQINFLLAGFLREEVIDFDKLLLLSNTILGSIKRDMSDHLKALAHISRGWLLLHSPDVSNSVVVTAQKAFSEAADIIEDAGFGEESYYFVSLRIGRAMCCYLLNERSSYERDLRAALETLKLPNNERYQYLRELIETFLKNVSNENGETKMTQLLHFFSMKANKSKKQKELPDDEISHESMISLFT